VSDWVPIPDTEHHEINDQGEIRYRPTARLRKPSLNQQGIPFIILPFLSFDRPTTKSLAVLVAESFVPGKDGLCNSVICLNGDREDCRAVNLRWRPRHFAIAYHKQLTLPRPAIVVPIREIDSEEEFEDSRHAAQHYGLLERNIATSVVGGNSCFPTSQRFELIR